MVKAWESILQSIMLLRGWFEDAKFGIFIHWGLYSVPVWGPTDGSVYEKYAEWYWRRMMLPETFPGQKFRDFHDRTYGPGFHYQDFACKFKAEMFDPEEWAEIFKDAGAHYLVLTSKHHEGFALWPSKHACVLPDTEYEWIL